MQVCAATNLQPPSTSHNSPSPGNPEPSFVIPSCIAVDDSVGSASTGSVATKKGPRSRSCAQVRSSYAPSPSAILQVASMTSTFSSGTKHCKRLRTTATSDVPHRSARSSPNLFYSGIPFSTARLRIGTLWSATGREAYSSARSPPFIGTLHILTLVEDTCGVSLKSTTSCSLNPPSTHPRTAKLRPKSCLRPSAWPGSTSACRPF
jgi:hypothetical protein